MLKIVGGLPPAIIGFLKQQNPGKTISIMESGAVKINGKDGVYFWENNMLYKMLDGEQTQVWVQEEFGF